MAVIWCNSIMVQQLNILVPHFLLKANGTEHISMYIIKILYTQHQGYRSALHVTQRKKTSGTFCSLTYPYPRVSTSTLVKKLRTVLFWALYLIVRNDLIYVSSGFHHGPQTIPMKKKLLLLTFIEKFLFLWAKFLAVRPHAGRHAPVWAGRTDLTHTHT